MAKDLLNVTFASSIGDTRRRKNISNVTYFMSFKHAVYYLPIVRNQGISNNPEDKQDVLRFQLGVREHVGILSLLTSMKWEKNESQ